MGIKRALRLRKSKQFQEIRQKGRSLAHPLFILNWRRNDLGSNRYGFAVGKKVGKAVVRNTVKRRMREVCRHLHDHLAAGWDIVLIARQTAVAATFAEIQHAIEQLFKRASVWITSPQPTIQAQPGREAPMPTSALIKEHHS